MTINHPGLPYPLTSHVEMPAFTTKSVRAAANLKFGDTLITATCDDAGQKADYVLTPTDIRAVNSRMAAINTHIKAKAGENGYAYFALSALYDRPKGSLNIYNVLFSSTPFGPNISLDGIHPSAAGQKILADTAVKAVNTTYGAGIP